MYAQPNANQAGASYVQPNSTYTKPNANQAGATYAQPNITSTQPSTTYNQSNLTYTQAIPTYTQPGATYSQTNLSYTQPNLTYTQPNTTYTQPNASYSQTNASYVQPNLNYTQNPTLVTQANPTYTDASALYTGPNQMMQSNTGYIQGVNMVTYYKNNQPVASYPTAGQPIIVDKSQFYQSDNSYLNNYATNQASGGYVQQTNAYQPQTNQTYPVQLASQTNDSYQAANQLNQTYPSQVNAAYQPNYQAILNNSVNSAYTISADQSNAGYPSSTNQTNATYPSNQTNAAYPASTNQTNAAYQSNHTNTGYPTTTNQINAAYPASTNQTNAAFPASSNQANAAYSQTNAGYPSPATANVYNQQQTPSPTPIPPIQPNTDGPKKESSIDLLAGLDFSISQAPLIPQKEPKDTKQELEVTPQVTKKNEEKKNPEPAVKIQKNREKSLKKGSPFKNADTVKQFIQEVDKFEKYVDGLNTKTLSGPSNLDLRWKEIQDCQENLDSLKKSISVARCYPLKNRSPDILPYDYSRVELKMARDDYINASKVKDISPFCMDFIVTQTPTNSTISDFWTMVWEQQVETIVCLLSNNELKEEMYWPSDVGKEVIIQTNIVTMLSCTEKEFWTERKINYAHLEIKESRIITLLQFTSWPGSLFPTNPLPFVDFIKRVITIYNQQKCNGNPVLVHCLAGVGRSGISTVMLATLMELAATGVPLPDIPSLACKMSNARKNILRDREHLKFVYTSLLSYLQTLKREFTKSDSEKSEDTNIVPIEKVAVDPLSTLDPLWATRK